MQTFLWTWLALTGLTVLVWTSRHLQLSRAKRLMPPLHAGMYADSKRELPPVSLLVAAKDEASNIESCLRSLVALDYPRLEIIAVNDRSTDATPQLMDRIAAGGGKLRVIHVTSLRDGWFGKNNAMREGLEHASSDWLCFTDADCIQVSPRSLRIAMEYALEKDFDFLSVLPAHETGSFLESVIQPACSGIMMIWFNPMKVNNPASRTAYANGAFMLMKRSCYDAIGGHDAVKTELNEDMHMARLAKQRGQRLAVVSNLDLYTVRMYETFAQTRAGWSRIFYGCFGTLRRLLVTGIVVMLFSILPWLTFTISAAMYGLAGGGDAWRWLLSLSAAVCLMQWTVMFRFYKLSRLNPFYAIAYPIGAVVGLWAIFGAIRRLGGRATITWRGTTYRGDRVDTAPSPSVAATK